jgi:hypothetical protein
MNTDQFHKNISFATDFFSKLFFIKHCRQLREVGLNLQTSSPTEFCLTSSMLLQLCVQMGDVPQSTSALIQKVGGIT